MSVTARAFAQTISLLELHGIKHTSRWTQARCGMHSAGTSCWTSKSPAMRRARCVRAAVLFSWVAPAAGASTTSLGIVSAATAALPPFTATLALELAPIRVNLIAAGFVDTPLSAALLGDQLEERRNELRAKLPIGRVVTAADVAALAVHLITNSALTGATYDIDGGQQFVS